MGFVGAVAAAVRQALADYAKTIELPPLLIGAGNFTVASALRSGGYRGAIYACDVSLYTSALGAFLTGTALAISEKPDCPEHLRNLLDTATPLKTAASVGLLYDLREVWQQKNPYQTRVIDQYRRHWPDLMARTSAKLVKYKAHIGAIGYTAQDGFDFLQAHDPGQYTAFAFPPTYKRGYERLEKLLRAVIDWQPPPYREMTDASLELYRLVSHYQAYFVVLEKDLPEVYGILGPPCAILQRGRGAYSYIVAKSAAKKIVVRKTIQTEPAGPVRPPEKAVTGAERLSIIRLTLKQSLRLNELFLSPGIDYFEGGVGVSLGFCLDDQIIGKADFCRSAHQWKLPEEKPMIYLMSDLAVPSSTRRLSKLVLLALLSRQVKEILDLHYITAFHWAITTAFSRHPASMKYRGVFKLHKRKKTENGYMLNYFAPFAGYPVSDALDLWKRRYGR